MAVNGNGKPKVLVALQLTGGNDFMNTVIPFTNSVYYDNRPTVAIPEDQVLPLNDTLAWHPSTAPLKELYDQGNVAIIQGIGYPNASRSHFRALDVMHTCEPEKVGDTGWLGLATHELDPGRENVLTAVSFGRGLPRALASAGVPVTSVGDLENYGLMTGISDEQRRSQTIDYFKAMYAPAVGTGPVMDYLSQTGMDVLSGADRLKAAPANYSSEVEYAGNTIAKSLRDVARVHLADLGTRIFFVSHGGYDVHANENPDQPRLLSEFSGAVMDFYQDLKDHDAADEVAILVYTEFGRRIKDNGTGTDHGSGGGAFIIGENVNGGLYSEYPSLEPSQWERGEDMKHTIDFRGIYGTMLEQWLDVEAAPIVGGDFEQVHPFEGAGG